MKFMLKETVVRWNTIEVQDDEELSEMEPWEVEEDPDIREVMREDIAANSWDGEDVLEASWEQVDE